jgi:hypothetical protein
MAKRKKTPLSLLGRAAKGDARKRPDPSDLILLSPAARAVATGFAELSESDRDRLCSCLHPWMPPGWTLVRTGGLQELEDALWRVLRERNDCAGERDYYAKREHRTNRPELQAKVRAYWSDGERTEGQVYLELNEHYPHLLTRQGGKPMTVRDVGQIIQWIKRKRRR